MKCFFCGRKRPKAKFDDDMCRSCAYEAVKQDTDLRKKTLQAFLAKGRKCQNCKKPCDDPRYFFNCQECSWRKNESNRGHQSYVG